jgi:TonB family protein
MPQISTLIVAAVLSAGLYISPAVSQAQAQAHPERRAIEKVGPIYPELAKRAHLKGVVKMEVVVRPNGNVKSAKVLGGNPVLLEAASDAVYKWKFAPSAEETIEIVEIEFVPR